MKKQKWIRKGMAFVLSLAMVAGLVPAMSGGANTVQAATENGTGNTPSVSAYATKEQMMGDTFAPDSNGNVTNIGKLIFGKNSSGASQEWYILGKDSGVEGENTILFAVSPIAPKQKFEDDGTNNKTFDSSFGVYATNPSEVCPNHYGASDLRVALQTIEADASYFTKFEQNLMNPTTVTTQDTLNNADYTTTDKLYALATDGEDSQTIKAGSNNQILLERDSYWGESCFWLRTPQGIYNIVLSTDPESSVWVSNSYDGNYNQLQPASNLNLSSVLFASGAKVAASDTAESGTIASDTAMKLRMDGENTAIGTVIYDAATGGIAAQKDANAEKTVSLVVQGNDGTNDWYYSVPVGSTTYVTAEQIKSEVTSLSGMPNLADCKIWLETTIDNVAYAKMAEAKGSITVVSVNSVAVSGMDVPVGGGEFDTKASCNTTGIVTTEPAITYTTAGENGDEEVTGMAEWNTTYKAAVTLSTGIVGDGVYMFGNSVSVTVDGEALTSALTPNADGTLTVTKEFSKTAKRKIGSVETSKVPTNNIFTTYYGYEGYDTSPVSGSNSELGTQATVTFTDSVNPNTEDMDMAWSIENVGGAAYDKTPGAENTFRWTIPAAALTNYNATDCQGYDATTGTITGTVAITNKAATPVAITGTDSGVAYTGETIDVSQYFTIDSHAGAATYSLVTGVDGGTGVGTLSGTTLTVNKTGTFKIKVETLANGIYGAGEKTITLTVSNGIIEYAATDYSGTYDGQPHSISVNVTNPEGTIISYSTDGENYGSDNPSFTNAGNYTVYYRITKDNYNTISENSTVNVAKAASAPGLPNNTMKVDYGKKKVSDITTLPEGWAWQDEDKALTVGTAVKATAVYTGADKGNYEVESVEISITRAECTHATKEVKNAKDATCTEKGYTGDTYCKDCGVKLADGTEIAMTDHKWDAGKVTKEATETAEGVKTYTCSVCGETKTEAIPKKTATTPQPPKKGDVVKDDKTSVKVEVSDVKKKEVEYKEPVNKKAKTVSIPATVKINGVTYKVTKIADNAFKNNKTVTKVTVGSNIKTIGKNAFYKCTKLKTVKIGKNVTTIGSNAFKGCTSLTSVTLPSKATKIGANAFSGCKKLKTIKITSTKLSSKTVSKNAFKGLTKATTIKVPKKKLSAYKKLFKQKGLSSKVKVKGY